MHKCVRVWRSVQFVSTSTFEIKGVLNEVLSDHFNDASGGLDSQKNFVHMPQCILETTLPFRDVRGNT